MATGQDGKARRGSLPVNQSYPRRTCLQLPMAEAAFQRQMCMAANDWPPSVHSPLANPQSAALQNRSRIALLLTISLITTVLQSIINTPEQLFPASILIPLKVCSQYRALESLLKSTSDPNINTPTEHSSSCPEYHAKQTAPGLLK